MFKFYIFIFLVLASDALNIPVQKNTNWWEGPIHYFHGYCDLPIDKTYPIGQVKVDLILDTPSDSIQIWKLDISETNCKKTKYSMHNKYEIHQGVEKADFILKYTAQKIPSGSCVTNLP